MNTNTPSEPPPAYEETAPHSAPTQPYPTTTNPHKTRNGIPPDRRRSMEDEARQLPSGWTRQYDSKTHHQFFVDTSSSPPRSIWHHPFDDEIYMNSLSPAEHHRILALHKVPSEADIEAESSDEEDHPHPSSKSGNDNNTPHGISKLGRKMKDKLTNSTHTEREQNRRKRAEEEQRAYQRHMHIRQQMSRAIETGEPQLLGRDKDGKEVYIEPPQQMGGMGGGGGFGGLYGGNGYGYNPYSQGPYANPNARFLRPQNQYNRPYGYGYGGGYGLPLAAGLGGGLMLGGLMW